MRVGLGEPLRYRKGLEMNEIMSKEEFESKCLSAPREINGWHLDLMIESHEALRAKLDIAVTEFRDFIENVEFHNYRGGEAFLMKRVEDAKETLRELGYQVGSEVKK